MVWDLVFTALDQTVGPKITGISLGYSFVGKELGSFCESGLQEIAGPFVEVHNHMSHIFNSWHPP